MPVESRTDSVRFTTKGQVVIPVWLRRQFEIQDGTKAIVQATPEGILLRPITRASVKRLRGMLKKAPGDRPLAEEWAQHRAEQIAVEEAKYARSTGAR
jgi:AbrB family looped-hinge helix DNA binding protein